MNEMMNKLPIYLIMLLLAILPGSCGRKSSTAATDKVNDSLYRRSYIYQISKSDPERALALADTAEMLGLLRADHSSLDLMKSIIYYNGFRQPKLARHYALKAYEDTELRKDTIACLTNLNNLVAFCYETGDFAGAIRYASQGIEMNRACGRYNVEGKLLMRIAMSQHALGMDKEAKANMKRSIAICKEDVDRNPSWSNVQNLFYTMGETMNELCEMGDWQQAAALIPDLLKTNSLHEQQESEAPAGIIDMYRLYTYAQCMEIYQHLGYRKLADEYYRKCLSTEFVKSPEGLGHIIRYQLLNKDYQLALHNIQTAKQGFERNQKTDSETYVNELLAAEAEALTRLGRYKEAADVSRQIIALKDTLFKRKQRDGAQELAIIYETGEKEAQLVEQAAQLRENRMILLFAVCVISLLGLLLWRMFRHSRIVRKKNEAMAGTITGLLKYKEELYHSKDENLLLQEQLQAAAEALRQQRTVKASLPDAPEELMSGEAVPEADVADSDIDPDLCLLFKRVEHEIISKQLFLRPELSREELMKLLHIPKNKFAPLFKRNTGMKYPQYINKLKLEYAAKLLKEHPDYSMDAIAQSCGILSGSTFYRLFSENYGMTPLDFRRSIKIADNKRDTPNNED